MTTVIRCEHCAAWQEYTKAQEWVGACRRWAPRPAVGGLFPNPGESGETWAVWPVTHGDDGCMEGIAHAE